MKKITLMVDDDLFEDVNKHIPWGFRKHVMSTLLRMAVEIAKKDGQIGLAAVMDDSFSLRINLKNAET